MAFTGGTGVLVFLDLVAYIFRKNVHKVSPAMDLIKDEDFGDLNDDFKFILYMAFPTEGDALAYDFCKSCMEHAKQNSFSNFEVRTRFSDKDRQRWDEQWIGDTLSQVRDLKRVWVCGPPIINETFNKALQKHLDKSKFEVM